MGDSIVRQVSLSWIRKVAEEARKKPVTHVPSVSDSGSASGLLLSVPALAPLRGEL